MPSDPMLDPRASDPGAVLASIELEQAETRRSLAPHMPVLFGAWGPAWLTAAIMLYLAARDALPLATALVVIAAVLVAAGAVSAVHTIRRSAAVTGPSDVRGAILGNTFAGGFVLCALIVWRFAAEGLELSLVVTLAITLLCAVFGLLTLAGLALHRDRTTLTFGLMLVATAVGCLLVPYPGNILVLGAGGGGGMLAIAIAGQYAKRGVR